MTNVDTTATATTGKKKRESIADHHLIATVGGEHTAIDKALGIRYTDKASGEVFEYMMPGAVAGSPITMFALFGAKTKATNETSRVRNGKGGDVTAQFEALDEVFEAISAGNWKEEAEGGGGSRTDKDLLHTILMEFLGESADKKIDYRARMDSEKGYVGKILKEENIEAEYRKRSGKVKKVVTLADLA